MFFSNKHAHMLCLFSSTTAALGVRFDDVKWFVSVCVSLFGTCAALWIFRANQKAVDALDLVVAKAKEACARDDGIHAGK